MVKEREATQVEKDQIRSEMEQKVVEGATEYEIRELRKQLAVRLGLTLSQVKSITAWKRTANGNGLILKPLEVLEKNEEFSILDIQTNNTDTTSQSQNLSKQQAECTSVSMDDVESSQTMLENRGSIEISSISSEEDDLCPDYDNEEKMKSRIALRNFIDQCIPQNERRGANVLILPGPNWLEVRDVFDALGFKREHIWGAEIDPHLQDQCSRKAAELQTNFFGGKVQDLLQQTELKFKVVHLDFKGQICPAHLQAFEMLPLENSAIVGCNFWRRRERKEMQQLVQATARYVNFAKMSSPELRDVSCIHDKIATIINQESNLPLQEACDLGLGWAVLGLSGVARRERWIIDPDLIDEIGEVKFPSFLDEIMNFHKNCGIDKFSKELQFLKIGLPSILGPVWAAMACTLQNVGIPNDELVKMGHFMGVFISSVLTRKCFAKKIEKFQYVSPENKTSFISHFAHMYCPEYEYQQLQPTAKIMFDIALDSHRAVMNGNPKGKFHLEDIQRNRIVKNHGLVDSDRLVYTQDDKEMTKLRMRDLFRDYGKFITLCSKYAPEGYSLPSNSIEYLSRFNRIFLMPKR